MHEKQRKKKIRRERKNKRKKKEKKRKKSCRRNDDKGREAKKVKTSPTNAAWHRSKTEQTAVLFSYRVKIDAVAP